MSEVICKCNYHLGMGPNLLCPAHGKREDLARRIESLEKENVELRKWLTKIKNASHGADWTKITVDDLQWMADQALEEQKDETTP